jgi:hypothetical protein
MAVFSTLANQMLPLTTALSGITLAIGLCACPMQSLALQHAFVILSAVTVLGATASFAWHICRPTPYECRIKYEFGLIPLALFWGCLLIPCSTVREAGARFMTTSNGKQIGLGMHSFHDANKHLPANICDVAGTPILSWRVSISPYVEAVPIHQQFDLTKPWDSPANFPLIEKIPFTLRSVLFEETVGNTPWQGFVGKGTAFEPGKSLTLARDFPDGTSNTIFFVEAQQHVPWSKPADIFYGPDIPLPPLGQPYPHRGDWPFCCSVRGNPIVLACMADCTVRSFKADIPEHRLRSLIVRNDGEPSDGWLPDN